MRTGSSRSFIVRWAACAAGVALLPAAWGQSTDASRFPVQLRQAVASYPVTLYAGKDCAPCDQGRQLLQSRGVPYTEYKVETPDDIQALTRLSGGRSLPTLSVGRQVIKGLNGADWNDYLTAAGYPAASQLPAGYRFAAALPLTTPARPDVPAAPAPTPRAPEPAPPSPTGIRF